MRSNHKPIAHKYKKYIMFIWDNEHACGGLDDIDSSFDTLEEAKASIKYQVFPWGERIIVDRDTWETIYSEMSEGGVVLG